MTIVYKPIGIICTPFKKRTGMPIQSIGAKGKKGKIILNDEFVSGLTDLDGFSHIILLYHFHKSNGYNLITTPFLDDKKHGVFATRAPARPNPIGLSIVRLLSINENIIHIENVDILDKTPLLDIKPYIPDFDIHTTDKDGWIGNKDIKTGTMTSDNRFR